MSDISQALLPAITSKKDFPLRSFLEGVCLELRGLEGYFKIIFWNIRMPYVRSALSVKTHVTQQWITVATLIMYEPDLRATADSSQSRPHIKAALTRLSLLRLSNVALECCSVSKKEPEMMSLHGRGSHLSWCEKKQRKRKKETKPKCAAIRHWRIGE